MNISRFHFAMPYQFALPYQFAVPCIALLLLVSACSGSSSSGGTNTTEGTVLINFDGTDRVFPLLEQRSFEVLPSVATDTVDVVDWRFSAAPLRSGALAQCGGRDGFDLTLAVDTLAQACASTAQCNFDFDQSAVTNTDGSVTQRFVVDVPVLRAPVGLLFGLDGRTSLDEPVNLQATFCLIPENDPPVAGGDSFTVIQGETLNITPASPINLLSNDVDDVDTSNLPLRVSPTPIAPPQQATQFELRSDGGFSYLFNGDLAAQGTDRISDSFTYQLTDGQNTTSAEVRITVVTRDDPPLQISGIPAHTAIAGIPTEFDFSSNFQDPEGSQLVFSVVESTLPPASDFEVSVLGVLTGIAANADIGSFTVAVNAADGLNSVDANFLLNVIANQSPQISQQGSFVLGFGELINLTVQANDPEGQPLTYTLISEPASDIRINSDTGLITGSPETAGDFEITVLVDDGFTTPASTTFTVTQLEQPNRAPVFGDNIANQAVTLGEAISPVTGQFTDLDGDDLTFAISSTPPGLLFNASTGTLSGTPGQLGAFSLTITAADEAGLQSSSNSFTITVAAIPNEAPEFQAPVGDQSAVVGEAITPFTVDFEDPEGGALTFSASGLPAGLTIDTATGQISGTAQSAGTFSVFVTAQDSVGDSATSNTFAIVVTAPANTGPVFSGTIVSQSIVLGNAIQPVSGNFSDPDGGALTFSVSPLPAGLAFSATNGTVSGTPTAAGTSTVTITATDPDGESASSNPFTITVTAAPNAVPVFSGPIPDQAGTVGDPVTPLSLAGFFNDTDAGDSLTIALAAGDSLPPGLTLNANDTISGTPTASGTTTLVVTATDDDGASVTSNSFDYVIGTGNVAPQITTRAPTGTVTIIVGDAETINITATDESLATASFSAVSSDTDVVDVTIVDDDEYLFDATGVGTAMVTIVVTDADGLSDTEVVPVVVEAIANLAPEITGRLPGADPITTITVADTDPITFTVADEDAATVVLSATSSDAAIVQVTAIDDANSMVFLMGQAPGTATITVTATDDGGLTDEVSFEVTIPTNGGPAVNGAVPDQEFEQGVVITPLDVSVLFTDPDGDTLEFSVDQLPEGLVLDPDSGEISGIPTAIETVTVTVGATDVDGTNTTTDAAPFEINVIAPPVTNSPPVAIAGTDVTLTVGETGVAIDVATLFTDTDGDVLAYSVDDLPDGLTLDPDTGLIEGIPTTQETVLVTVSATDPLGSGMTTDALPPFEIDVIAATVAVTNLPPVFSGTPDDLSLTQNMLITPVDFSVFFSDPENDTLTFSANQLPDGLMLDPTTGLLDGTPTTVESLDVVISAADLMGSGLTTDAPEPFEIEVES